MSQYRLFFLDAAGRSFRSQRLDCADETEAVRRARTERGGHAVELWYGAEVLGRFPAEMQGVRGSFAGQPRPARERT